MKHISAHAYEEIIYPEETLTAISPDMRVAFILMNKFTLAPVTGLVESLRFAADQSFRSLQIYCKWDWMTFNNTSVSASCGLTIQPTTDFNLENLKKNYDYIVLAGGLLSETREPPQDLLDALKELHHHKVPIIALCSACFVLVSPYKSTDVQRYPDATHGFDNILYCCNDGELYLLCPGESSHHRLAVPI
ncbi:hypothetical protein FQR65_LT17818 [Abscondita terminalis]|nr:hypothetical protein FQR65_LT17818 [Abscondita terminalis]